MSTYYLEYFDTNTEILRSIHFFADLHEKIRTGAKASVLISLTSQPHQHSESAVKIIGVRAMSIWWRWGELNPRPKAL